MSSEGEEEECLDLYEVLGLTDKTASKKQIRRQYLRKAKMLHPDKIPGGDEERFAKAKEEFLQVSIAYTVLSDEKKRKRYDRTGCVPTADDELVENMADWGKVFSTVTLSDLDFFKSSYQGSPEEEADIKGAYEKHHGDMGGIIDEIPFCNAVDDEARMRQIIESLIQDGKVKTYGAYEDKGNRESKKRKRKAKREAREAEELAQELGLGAGGSSLEAAILARKQSREAGFDSFLNNLEAKYAKPAKKPKKHKRKAR
mmetsp:Transcript_19335/g.54287  ORF Transcript_19335/g.54287 Transcript_19335/m.54287 type:complete len:257 (+) Transcript_19335:76-846(+)